MHDTGQSSSHLHIWRSSPKLSYYLLPQPGAWCPPLRRSSAAACRKQVQQSMLAALCVSKRAMSPTMPNRAALAGQPPAGRRASSQSASAAGPHRAHTPAAGAPRMYMKIGRCDPRTGWDKSMSATARAADRWGQRKRCNCRRSRHIMRAQAVQRSNTLQRQPMLRARQQPSSWQPSALPAT